MYDVQKHMQAYLDYFGLARTQNQNRQTYKRKGYIKESSDWNNFRSLIKNLHFKAGCIRASHQVYFISEFISFGRKAEIMSKFLSSFAVFATIFVFLRQVEDVLEAL